MPPRRRHTAVPQHRPPPESHTLPALAARAALDRAPFIAPDLVPFFTKLKTFFCCWGWMYIIGLFLGILFLLAYAGIALWAVSSGQLDPQAFFNR